MSRQTRKKRVSFRKQFFGLVLIDKLILVAEKSAWDDLKGNKKEQNESSLEDLEEEEEDIPEIVLVENNDQLRDLENEIDAEVSIYQNAE